MSGYGRSTPKFLFCSLLNYLIPLVLLFGTNLSGANQQSPVNGNSLPDNFATLPDDIQAVLLEFLFYSEEAEAVWGKDMESTTRHVMVKYLDEFHTKVRVDFRKGIVQVDTRGAEQPLDALKHAITATLLT
ncbi:MAG: murein transglycosylase domain-containing protein, partial [Oceanobacter sp.]